MDQLLGVYRGIKYRIACGIKLNCQNTLFDIGFYRGELRESLRRSERIVKGMADFKNKVARGTEAMVDFLSSDTRPFSLEFSLPRAAIPWGFAGNGPETRFLRPDLDRKAVGFLIRNP
jgi:hypothetical protein